MHRTSRGPRSCLSGEQRWVGRAGGFIADDRSDWPHWRDDDRDCQNTREEVLIAESKTPVEFESPKGCDPVAGKWVCPYTGLEFTDPGDLDIDHLVPLRNAHVSGAWAWTRERRWAYANGLAEAGHLVAVQSRAYRQKGTRGPDEWLPQLDRCKYVDEWVAIKRRWQLSMTEVEADAVRGVWAGCGE